MTRRSDFDRRQAVARFYDEACAAIDKERWQEAVEKLDRVRDIDPDFPGAEYRQRLAHKWYRIAKLLEMGQRYMRSDRWYDALRCFRQITREVDEYKNAALLQRICERQLVPLPPSDNRRPLKLATAAMAMGLVMGGLAYEAWDLSFSLPPLPQQVQAWLDGVRPSPTSAFALVEPTEQAPATTALPADLTSTPQIPESTLSSPSITPNPSIAPVGGSTTQGNQPAGPAASARPTVAARPPTRTPRRFTAEPVATRPPATSTASPPTGSKATSTAEAPPDLTTTPGVTLEATPTTQPPTPVTTVAVAFVTDTPTPTPPTNTATPVPLSPTTTSTATPAPPTPTASSTATPIPPTPTATRTPVPPPTATPVPQAASIFITASNNRFAGGVPVQSGALVKLTLSNQDTVQHSWVLKDGSNNTLQRVVAAPGQNAILDFTAPPAGTYSFFCDVADHAQLGMTGKLTVR